MVFRCSVFAGVAGLALVGMLAWVPASEAAARVHTLTVTAASSETEHGGADTGSPGLSKGDTYVSNAKVRNLAGTVVGTYHVACTITDENDAHGNAWSICWTTAKIKGRGTLVATGLAELLHVDTAPGGFGVAPPMARFAIVGGTGAYAGARGQVTSKRTSSTRTLRYRFTL